MEFGDGLLWISFLEEKENANRLKMDVLFGGKGLFDVSPLVPECI